jgi:hypothetical protein
MRRVGKIVIIGEPVAHKKCSECGKVDELRPYGRGGAELCYDCAMKPINRNVVDKNMEKILKGRK